MCIVLISSLSLSSLWSAYTFVLLLHRKSIFLGITKGKIFFFLPWLAKWVLILLILNVKIIRFVLGDTEERNKIAWKICSVNGKMKTVLGGGRKGGLANNARLLPLNKQFEV